MREILFRGNRKDNGEWVEGYLNYNSTRKQYYIMDDVDTFPIPVHKESVGQYTGLTDKNGKKIFEGDIVQNKWFRYVIKHGAYIPTVYCKEKCNCFETIGFYAFDGERDYQLSNFTKMLEVTGNIHDNPELMKGD